MPDLSESMPTSPSTDALLQTLLEVSLTAVNLLRPVFEPATGGIVDFVIEYVNPAGQRMLALSEQPGGTLGSHFPESLSNGVFAFYRQVFETGEAGTYKVKYQADGLDNYFHLSARRCEQLVIVSFTDTAEQSRSRVELALRESQVREREGLAKVETQRQQLDTLFSQAPACIARLVGPTYIFTVANPLYHQLFGGRQLLGKTIREALPELKSEPFFGLLDEVYRTGETFYGNEIPINLASVNSSETRLRYFNFINQATRDASGAIDGILVFAYDISELVEARRQVEQSRQQVGILNEELAAANEELQAANEEFHANNAELVLTQQQLQLLNTELEGRVEERTQALQHAQIGAELERQRLERLFMQAPAAICILSGPDLVFELVNPVYQNLFTHRHLLNQPILAAMPEIKNNHVHETLRRVYEVGGTHEEHGLLIPYARREDEVLEDRYFSYIQQARYDELGRIDGVLVFAFETTEQVQAQQRTTALQAELLASAQRMAQDRETFYQIFEQTPACVCVLHGPEHRIEYFNEAYQKLFPGRQMWGRTVAETQPDAVAQGFLALLDNVYQTGETFYGNELLLSIDQLDGSPPKDTYFNFTYQAYQENGHTIGVSVFAYDVTEQVLMRQQHDTQRQQLERLFMQAPAAICILNGPDLVFELVNPSYQELFPERELLGRPILQVLPEIADHAAYQTFRSVYETGIAHEEKALLVPLRRDKDGVLEDRYFNYIQQARYDELGRIDGVLVFAFEVTQQVQARKASEVSAQQLRLITDSLPVLIGYLDKEEKYRFANQAYETWFNQRPEDLLGQPVREVVGEKAYQGVHTYIEQALDGKRLDFEAQMLYKENFVKHIRTSYVPDIKEDGKVAGFYTLITDITESVQAQRVIEEGRQQAQALADELASANAELGIANDQLRRTNVDLDNFIYTASHDLKAPITNIEGLLHALQKQLPAADQEGDVPFILTMMQGAVDRFKMTIDHLTEVSKLQKEHDQPAVSVYLDDVVEGVRLDLQPLFEQTQAQLEVDVQACPALSFSEKNLRSVVYNLLSNALKYRAPDRPARVQVRCRAEAEYIVLEVQDNGLGLDLSRQRQLFAMFQRYHTHVEGSGIGLYMVKKMVENAGGKIEVQSEVGVGSTFSVFFRN